MGIQGFWSGDKVFGTLEAQDRSCHQKGHRRDVAYAFAQPESFILALSSSPFSLLYLGI
jgi:hypothetical protein